MGLAAFNRMRMRLRRKEEMRPEKIKEASTKNVVEANPAREAYEQKVMDEAKAKALEAMEAKNKSKEKEPAKRGSSRKK